MSIYISAIICTHNRAKYLEKAIQSLVNQKTAKGNYEVIVIDNRSSDNTKQIVTNFSMYPNIRYIYQSNLGLSYARNTGWQNAKGKYVAYLDDDAIASENWLEKILEVFDTVSPKPGCIGGVIEPIWEASRPEWLSDRLLHGLAVVNWSDKPHYLANISHEWLAGTNIAFSIELIERVGGFTVGLDRKGNNLLSNGDVSIQKKIIKAGYSCYYHPEIVVSHHIFPSRLKKNWFTRRYYWQGISDSVMQILEESPSIIDRLKLGTSKSMALLQSPRTLINLLLPTNDPQRFTEKCFSLITVGQVVGLLSTFRN